LNSAVGVVLPPESDPPHHHDPRDEPGKFRIGSQRQPDIGQRAERDDRYLAGTFTDEAPDHVDGRLGDGLALRGREVDPTESVAAVCFIGMHRVSRHRDRRAGGDRRFGPSADFHHPQSVHHPDVQRNVAHHCGYGEDIKLRRSHCQ
jgi:hypothetical protein